MMFGKVLNYIKRKKKIINSFDGKTEYMSAGTYVLDDSLKYFTRNDKGTKDSANKILQTDYYSFLQRLVVMLMRKTLFRKKVTIREQNIQIAGFSGTVFRPVRGTNGYNDSRIFDLEHKKVLSIFTEENEFQSVIENYEYFNQYFPMPKILWADNKGLQIMEELVSFQPYNSWSEEDYLYVLDEIFDRYFEYLSMCCHDPMTSNKTAINVYQSLSKNNEIQFLMDKINPAFFKINIPYRKLHGDLWTSNILFAKGEKNPIKFIDWEHSKEFMFFYDIFNFMWLEYYVHNNLIYLDKYFSGEYDDPFERIFSLFKLPFAETCRMDYLNIFLLNFFEKRLVYLDEIDRKGYINKYKRLLEEYESSYAVV